MTKVLLDTRAGAPGSSGNPVFVTPTGGGDSSAANQVTLNTEIGATNETSAGADNSTSGLNGLIKRLLARITSIFGDTTDAVVAAGAAGSIAAKLRAISRDIVANIVLAAGENMIGKVAANSTVIQVALTVSTTPAYTANDLIGGKITISNALRVSGGTGTLQSLEILDRAAQKPAGILYIFNADPTVGTYTDNAAPTVSTDDLKVIAQIPVSQGDYVTTNNKSFAAPAFNPKVVKAASGTSLYAIFQTTSTPTFAATTDVQLTFGILQD